jgi:hypothetical protein
VAILCFFYFSLSQNSYIIYQPFSILIHTDKSASDKYNMHTSTGCLQNIKLLPSVVLTCILEEMSKNVNDTYHTTITRRHTDELLAEGSQLWTHMGNLQWSHLAECSRITLTSCFWMFTFFCYYSFASVLLTLHITVNYRHNRSDFRLKTNNHVLGT